MGFEFVTALPTPEEIRTQFPLKAELSQLKQQRDEEIRRIITGQSKKFLVLVGPCSADNEDSVVDYASRLVKVQQATADNWSSCPGCIPTSPVPPARDIWG